MPLETTRKLIAVYWGCVTLIDQQIGRVLAALDRQGLVDETAVFFSCDHGEFTGAHRLHDMGPARYEDIYRTPGIVRIPGAPAGQARCELVGPLDCTAMTLDLAGLDTAPALDSRSLVPLVNGEHPDWAPDIICEFHGLHFRTRNGCRVPTVTSSSSTPIPPTCCTPSSRARRAHQRLPPP